MTLETSMPHEICSVIYDQGAKPSMCGIQNVCTLFGRLMLHEEIHNSARITYGSIVARHLVRCTSAEVDQIFQDGDLGCSEQIASNAIPCSGQERYTHLNRLRHPCKRVRLTLLDNPPSPHKRIIWSNIFLAPASVRGFAGSIIY